jgi:hypothetical protein
VRVHTRLEAKDCGTRKINAFVWMAWKGAPPAHSSQNQFRPASSKMTLTIAKPSPITPIMRALRT